MKVRQVIDGHFQARSAPPSRQGAALPSQVAPSVLELGSLETLRVSRTPARTMPERCQNDEVPCSRQHDRRGDEHRSEGAVSHAFTVILRGGDGHPDIPPRRMTGRPPRHYASPYRIPPSGICISNRAPLPGEPVSRMAIPVMARISRERKRP